ncbi:MAG: transposase [Kribbellaceae bacterium]|nr:transposase [Kribbellaceae bacterium]
MTTMTPEPGFVTGGVDTHLEVHVCGGGGSPRRRARHRVLPDDRQLLSAAVALVGLVRAGAYGGSGGDWQLRVALAAHLTAAGLKVIEVSRPNRQIRRQHGKTDIVDAIAAAGQCCPVRPQQRRRRTTGRLRPCAC